MKEHYIDIHSDYCKQQTERTKQNENISHLSSFCDMNPNRFLFFLGNRFFLITYHNCIGRENDYDFKVDLIKNINEKTKTFQLLDIDKSYYLEDVLKDYRKNDKLKKYQNQVNYIYYNNAGKEYCICSRVNFIDSICDQEEIDKNYNICKDYLIKNGRRYEYLLDQLEKLYHNNKIYEFDKVEVHRTIEHLINQINTEINGNHKKSKH